MQFPASTGQVALQLGVTEPRLNDLIRRGKVPSPPLTGGRRLWDEEYVARAAAALGVDVDEQPAVAPSA